MKVIIQQLEEHHEKEKQGMLQSLTDFLSNVFCGNQDNLNPLGANFTKWSNTLKQFVGKLPANSLSVFDHFVALALKGSTLS